MKKYKISLEWIIEADSDGKIAGYDDVEDFLWECSPEPYDFTVEEIEE